MGFIFDKLFNRKPQPVYFQLTLPRAETERHPIVNLQYVTLGVSEAMLIQNIATDDVSGLIYALEASLREQLATSTEAFEVRATIVIYPNRPVTLFVLTGRRIKGVSVQALSNTLQTIDGMHLQTKQQPVPLSAHFLVNTAVAR